MRHAHTVPSCLPDFLSGIIPGLATLSELADQTPVPSAVTLKTSSKVVSP
jgi:hypothetical protein